MNRSCMNTMHSTLAEWLEPKVATQALFMSCSDFCVPTNKPSHLPTCVLHSHMFNTPTCLLLCTLQLICSHSIMFHSSASSLLPTNSFSHSIYPLKYILLVKFIFYIIQWTVFEKSDLRAEYWVLFVNLTSFIVSHSIVLYPVLHST